MSWTPPADDMIDLWRVDLAVTEDDRTLLSEDERKRAERIIIPDKRDQFVAARAALRHTVARYIDREPEAVEFAYAEHGKPAIEGVDLSFNLSHSATVALIGITRGASLGVDVERAEGDRDLASMAKHFFADAEYAAWLAMPVVDQPLAFLRLWTLKEAYLKAWGTGLSFSSRRFSLMLDGDPRLSATEMPGDDPGLWRFAQLPIGGPYAAAVCWSGAPRTLRCFHYPAEPGSASK